MGCKINMWPRWRALKYHRKMWNSIADDIERNKRVVDIVEAKSNFCRSNGFNVSLNCFLCECADIECSTCPVTWGANKTDTCTLLHNGHDGLYTMCEYTGSWEEQAALARQIANLPERKV